MSLNAESIKNLIKKIGFVPQDGKNGSYYKNYTSHNNYTIFVDFNSEKIIYDSAENLSQTIITVGKRTTSNFSQAENFVILECVDNLLEKGYTPACIELEKTYPSGHGCSGRLDILVKSVDGIPFLMIECKTWGAEFEKEHNRMLRNGGQLFTYYANDRAAKFLCLYTSRIDDTRECQCAVIDVEPAWISLSGVKEIYDHWNKNFKDNGIFDSCAYPYDVKHKALTYGKLEILKEEHSGKIYNQIMEILRHNAISDKPNAFNKLLNLFVCKIIDETDKNPEDELDFQWLESDTDESLQLRLNDLYKKGMWRFLEITVIDYEQQEVSAKLANIDDDLTRQWIMKMYIDTRLKKSPNFAFAEVQDDRTFELNAKIVKEIVELLQVYRFRYEQKHEFLGNFFELLLNTSMKQEAGQFFTPVPITRFIISSLPLAELVQERVTGRYEEPMPTVIDYACGSGHFLTEYMSRMQEIIDNKIDLTNTSPRIKGLFQSWQGYTKFIWAKDSVYGIDLDNRLVKTAKVSAFFNGDGEANIIWANGLDSFTKSKAFRGKLVGAKEQDNGKFDLLISNPPYSVDAFKSTIKYGEESFELYSGLTDNSSEIECLFVERMKQLLKIGGWAAVILPSSILTNSGIHAKARTILLKYFKIMAIVEAGSNTFMKTNTNTVILFLKRRSNDDYLNISHAIERFFSNYEDVVVSGIESAFSIFVSNVYNELTFEDYISLLKGKPTREARSHELYKDYMKSFGDGFCTKAIENEKDKMLYFLLTYKQTIVLVKTGKGKEEKKFLGYEFSERRGHEGLHHLSGGTKLYDESDSLNPKKVSSYIYRAFLGETAEIDESLADNLSYARMSHFIEYGTSRFEKNINLGKPTSYLEQMRNKFVKFPMQRLNEISTMIRRGRSADYGDSGIQIIKSGQARGYYNFDFSKRYFVSKDFVSDERNLQHGDILINSTGVGTAGRVTLFDLDGNYVVDSHITIVRPDMKRVLPKYVLYLLADIGFDKLEAMANGQSGQIELAIDTIQNIKIPLPPLDVQQIIVNELRQIEDEEYRINAKIEKTQESIKALAQKCYQEADSLSKLKNVVHYSTERIDVNNLDKNTYVGVENLLPNVAGKRQSDYVPFSGTVTAYHSNDILLSNIRPYLKKAWLADNDGGSSGDVLVLCIDTASVLPKYVFLHVSSDRFFEYEMQNIGSNVKMPRADKKRVLDYQIPLLSIEEQKKIVEQVSQYEDEIVKLKSNLKTMGGEKEIILKKYL